MKSRIPQVQIGVLAAFVLIFVGLLIYQSLYIWPVQRCEAHGDWWDEKDHVCAVPVPISMFTGRTVGGKLVVAPARPAAKPGK
jgi:hypothetical protein